MTPYQIAAGSLFMAKEAGLQKLLQSASSATGLDPTRLQDALLAMAGGGALGTGVGALAGGGKGALLGGLLGGAGGAAGGYAGSPYVREMVDKIMASGADTLPPEILQSNPPAEENTDVPSLAAGLPGPDLAAPKEPGPPPSMASPTFETPGAGDVDLPDLASPGDLSSPNLAFEPSLNPSTMAMSGPAALREQRAGKRDAMRNAYPDGTAGDLVGSSIAKLMQLGEGPREAIDRAVFDGADALQSKADAVRDGMSALRSAGESALDSAGDNAGRTLENFKADPLSLPLNPLNWISQKPQLAQ